MLGLRPKLPVSDEDRQWVDDGFVRLEKLVGRHRMLEAKVVLPTAEDFPDPYEPTAASVERLFSRVCSYMRVDPRLVELEIFSDETEELREILPYWRGDAEHCAAGLYLETSQDIDTRATQEEKCLTVAIRSTQLKDPLSLVATIAHELGHVILLGGRLMDSKTPDHEPMTDLLTVFLGLGIFTANSAGRFRQYQDERRAGWSMKRLGYLSEQVYGYALARFALERGDKDLKWTKHLSANVRSDFKRSRAWLRKSGFRVE